MNAGQPPDGEPSPGVVPRLVDSDGLLVGKAEWNRFAGERKAVARCVCGGLMCALPPSPHDAQGDDGQVTWYEARCANCGREVAAPNGRVLRKSGAHLKMPRGWLEERERRDAEEHRKPKPGR